MNADQVTVAPSQSRHLPAQSASSFRPVNMSPPIVLGYWNIRGLAQPVRNILEYVGIDYEDKRYDFDMSDLTDMAKVIGDWSADKTGSPLIVGGGGEEAVEFPNLPYYIETRKDGSKLKITQSLTIMKHIARGHGLVVNGEEKVTMMEMYEQQAMDLRTAIVDYCYENPMVAWRYPNYAEDIKSLLALWEAALSGKKWLMGDTLTYVDFILVECLDWHVLLKSNMLDSFPNLKGYTQRFADLPKIKQYYQSGRYQDWPLVSPFAKKFGYHK